MGRRLRQRRPVSRQPASLISPSQSPVTKLVGNFSRSVGSEAAHAAWMLYQADPGHCWADMFVSLLLPDTRLLKVKLTSWILQKIFQKIIFQEMLNNSAVTPFS